MSNERIRSFIAVDLNEPAIQEKIGRFQKDLEETRAHLKMVDPNILHFTLRFLGEIPCQTVERVKEAMNELRFESFDILLNGIGAFPSLHRINVIWIGVTKGGEELQRIFQELEPKLREMGMAPDDKGFNPHLTIARVKSALNKEALAATISKAENLEFGKMSVTTVRLKKSILTPEGPIYSTIHEIAAT